MILRLRGLLELKLENTVHVTFRDLNVLGMRPHWPPRQQYDEGTNPLPYGFSTI